MRQKIFSILIALLIAFLLTSTAAAAGGVRLSGTSFSLGSLITSEIATGLGSTDWVFELDASGVASVVCTNYGGNVAPGQNYPHVEGRGSTAVPRTEISNNGKAIFSITARPPEEINPIISWDEGGCPNANWTAMVDFVYWQHATIYAIDPLTNTVVATFEYQCTTTRTGPAGDPNSTFDNGTVSCTQMN